MYSKSYGGVRYSYVGKKSGLRFGTVMEAKRGKECQCAQLPLSYKILLGGPADTAPFANPLSIDKSSASDSCFLLI